MKVRIETTQNVFIEYEPASIGDRILGYLIDLAIFFALLILCFYLIDEILEGEAKTIGAYIVAIPMLFYDFLFEVFFDGRSPGKLAMKTKVIDMSGQQPSIGSYLIRWMMRPIDFLILSGLLAFLSVLLGRQGQRLGDILAGTTVVKLKQKRQFSDVLFPEFDEEYEIAFPQVEQLSDKDINIVKEVLNRYKRTRDSATLQQMSRRVKETLGVSSDLPHYKFLDKVVKDYHHLSSTDL